MHDIDIDWEILARLRQRFLDQKAGAGAYWTDEQDLAHYHAFFAARIGWKWDNALDDAQQTGFQLRARTLLDWGCGSGIATLRVLERFGPAAVDKVLLYDHSLVACRFAQKTIAAAYPGLSVEIAPALGQIPDLSQTAVLVSHALNELTLEAQETLSQHLRSAAQILFVEAGNHTTSRFLVAQREALRSTHRILAPCIHCDRCPLLLSENGSHWCHFFGKPPIEAFTSGSWAQFATLMEIDLRSLPYSALFLENQNLPALTTTPTPAPSRLIGRPTQFKGYTRLLTCDATGLRELELQKRDDKHLWKSLKKGKDGSLYHWTELDQNRIKSGHPTNSQPNASS